MLLDRGLSLAQRLFQSPLFVAGYQLFRESPASRLVCGLSFPAEVRRLADVLARAPGRRFVEVGCGQASFGLGVAGHIRDARFTGVDISPAQLARAGRSARRRGIAYARVLGDGTRLPFRDATFDGALCVGALHQIPDARRAVAEAARVLRPGGVFAGACFTLPAAAARPFGMNALRRDEIAAWMHEAGLDETRCEATSPVWCFFDGVRAG